MKKIIIFLIVLITIILYTSCTTYTGAVYRGYNWSISPYGWNNPYLGPIWNQPWYLHNPYIIVPRYNTIPRIQPVQPPTRYERRHTPPSRRAVPNRNTDNTYPQRPSRIQNKPTTNLTPKWYAPQQHTNGNTTPMVTPQIIFQGPNGRGYSGPGAFGGN